jgi:CheY-like chemotaxis protein
MNAKKILVVDDSFVVIKALQLKLTAAGFAVTTARDGGEALAALRRDRPDLIVLDLDFPPDVGRGGGIAWDGILIMQWIGRIDEGKDIPVIIVTGQDPAKYRDKVLKMGARAFFTKPINNAELIESIRKTLSAADPSEAAA